MAIYNVCVEVTERHYYTVEAESPTEAREIAIEANAGGDPGYDDHHEGRVAISTTLVPS